MPKYRVYIGQERPFERSVLLGQWIGQRPPYPQTNMSGYDEKTWLHNRNYRQNVDQRNKRAIKRTRS